MRKALLLTLLLLTQTSCTEEQFVTFDRVLKRVSGIEREELRVPVYTARTLLAEERCSVRPAPSDCWVKIWVLPRVVARAFGTDAPQIRDYNEKRSGKAWGNELKDGSIYFVLHETTVSKRNR